MSITNDRNRSSPIPAQPNSEWLCAHGILSWKFPVSVGSFTLTGRSRAADATCLYIPELDTVLDCGCLVAPSRPLHIFVSHCHSDHCLDIIRLVNRRRPPQVFLPQKTLQDMHNYIYNSVILKADGRPTVQYNEPLNNCKLIGVQPDDFLDFRQNMKVRVFNMDHSVTCYGYGFYSRRQKLKPEYQHLSSKEIAALRHADRTLQLSEERMIPLFLFMGDTATGVFEQYPTELFQFPVIIIECSFIDNEEHEERAADVKHLIWVRIKFMNKALLSNNSI